MIRFTNFTIGKKKTEGTVILHSFHTGREFKLEWIVPDARRVHEVILVRPGLPSDTWIYLEGLSWKEMDEMNLTLPSSVLFSLAQVGDDQIRDLVQSILDEEEGDE